MIKIQQATKRYGTVTAVDQVTLEVAEAETLVLLGTSGSGKTTTLKLINRLIELTEGSIHVARKNIQEQRPEELRRNIGYVIQGAGLFPHYTVQENIAVVPRLLNWNKKETATRTHEVLEMLHLPPVEYLSAYPSELSGGQQQRVGLARALVTDPPVVLLDEPFGALDPITRAHIRQEFKTIEALRQKTMVLVTHDVQEAFELGDTICLMDSGSVQQLGTPQELVYNPSNAFVEQFLQENLFQLQLQVITLHQLLPFLPSVPGLAPAAHSLPGSATVLEAAQLLAKPGITSIAPAGERDKAADMAELLAAVATYRKSTLT